MLSSNAPRAFAALLEDHDVHRAGWRNKFVLKTLVVPGFNNDEPVVVRVNADGTAWPWTPTEDDLFADDWMAVDGPFNPGAPVYSVECFGAALYRIHQGGDVALPGTPLRLARGETHGGPCIDIVLPDGRRRVWRPQHQDLWAGYSIEADE